MRRRAPGTVRAQGEGLSVFLLRRLYLIHRENSDRPK